MNRMRKTSRPVLEGERTFPPYPVFQSKILQDLTPWFPLLLMVISFGIYSQNIFHDFTYDDRIWVLDDPRIWHWDIWGFIFESGNRWPLVARPLTFMLDYALFGLSPFGYQLHNMLWNSLCVVLVYFLLRKLTREATLSFFGALIFAIHPIHVEAVSNITNRKELLALAFVLIAFLCYVRFLEEHQARKWLWFLGAGVFWGLGLCSKQVAVVLPALLVAYEMLLVPRHQRFIAKNFLLLLGLIGIVSLLLLFYAFFVLDISNFQNSRVLTFTLKGYLGDLTYPAMVATSARAFWSYIQLLVWPSGMCPNHLVELSPSFLEFRALLAWIGLILYITIALAASLRWPLLAFGMLWFFIGFMPISNWVPSSYILADRYMFMPSVGYCIVLVALGQAIFQWLGRTHRQKAIGIASVLAMTVTIGYASTTLAYNQHWGNQETLMKYMLRCNPLSPQAYNGLGTYYHEQGQYAEAVRNFSRSIELGNLAAYGNRGNAYYQMRQYEAALNDYNQAINFQDYTRARSLKLTWVRPFNNRGTLLYELGEYEAALKDYERAISLNPDWGDPYYNRGILYLAQHNYEKAVEDFTRALKRIRDGSRVLNARGLAYEKLGNWTKAGEDYTQAISLDSSNGEAFFNLGRVQLHDNELEAAIRSYQTALQLGWERAEAVLKVLRKKGYLKE